MARWAQAAGEMDILERLAKEESPVHRLHPLTKLLVTVAYLVTVVSFPTSHVSGLISFLIYPVIMLSLSGTPLRPVMGRLCVALPFPLMGGLSHLFFTRGTAFMLGQFAVGQGMMAFASIMLKAFLTVFAVLLLMATTSFYEICAQLAALRVPSVFCLQLAMTYRYLTTLMDEAMTMYTAYALRTAGQKGIRIKDMGGFVGQLLLRSFDRAERIYQAMKCRGFRGVYPSQAKKKKRGSRPCDWLVAVLWVSVFLLLRVCNISMLLGGFILYIR